LAKVDDANTPVRIFRLLGQQSRQSLVDAEMFVRSHAVEVTFDDQRGWKWDLFADEPTESVETCAISCAIIALSAAGGLDASLMVNESVRTLLRLQLPSGGWTSWLTSLDDLADEDPEEALVVDTYFALSALNAVEMKGVEQFAQGIEWFCRVQDATTGGWGFYPGAPPQLLPTCMAIVSLAYHDTDNNSATRAVINRGVTWLLSHQGSGERPGWSIRADVPSAVHTAWALQALSAAGLDSYSPPVVAAREWLLDNVADRGSLIDHYVTPGLTLAGHRRASRAITHINFPEGIIVRGLLLAGTHILDPRLLAAVDQLVRDQRVGGYWCCVHAPKEQPIYALTDACVALRLFVDKVKTHESILEISEQILEHQVAVSRLAAHVETLRSGSQNTAAQLAEISAKIDDARREIEERRDADQATNAHLRQVEANVAWLSRGLTGMRPLMWLTRLIARWPILTVLIVLQIVAYCFAAFTAPPGYRLLSLIGGCLLTVVAAITFGAQMRASGLAAPPSKDQQ
jgi:hypothetical protein